MKRLDPTSTAITEQIAAHDRLRAEVDRLKTQHAVAITAAERMIEAHDRARAEVDQLQRFLDAEKTQCDGMGKRNLEALAILGGSYPDGVVDRARTVVADRDRLRALLEEALGELEDTAGEFAKQRVAEIRAQAGLS